MHEKGQVSNSEFLDEESKASCADCHERIFQGPFEDQFEMGQVELHIELSCWGKQMTEIFGDCHGFYDPVANYMEQPCHDKPMQKKNFRFS